MAKVFVPTVPKHVSELHTVDPIHIILNDRKANGGVPKQPTTS